MTQLGAYVEPVEMGLQNHRVVKMLTLHLVPRAYPISLHSRPKANASNVTQVDIM